MLRAGRSGCRSATFATLVALPLALLAPPAAAAVVAAAPSSPAVGLEVFAVCWDTTMQQQIPGHMLSRLYAYDALGSICLVPLGLAVDRAGRRRDRQRTATLYGAALALRRRDAAGVRGPRRQGAAKEVTASVFSSRSSR